jgi:hypothetical protein
MQHTIDTPLYIFNSIEVNGINVLLIVCELPNHELFYEIDIEQDVFYDAIIDQLEPIIDTLKGNILKDSIILHNDTSNTDVLSSIDNTDDVMLLMFVKHYLQTTKTYSFIYNTEYSDFAEFFSKSSNTNKYFRKAVFTKKFDIKLTIQTSLIQFECFGNEGTTDISKSEIKSIKQKIEL